MAEKRRRHLVKRHYALNPIKKAEAPTPPKKNKRKPSVPRIVKLIDEGI